MLKKIEEVVVEIQQQLVGGAGSSGCSCGCSCNCHCENSGYTSSRYTKRHSASQQGRFQGVRS